MAKKYQSLFFLIVAVITDCFSRAGGGGFSGGGGGGGGSYSRGYGRRGSGITWQEGDGYRLIVIVAIIVILFIVALKGYRWLIAYKASKARKILDSTQSDSAWNKEKLMMFINDSYLRMQTAWMSQNMEFVEDIVHPSLKARYQRLLDNQKRAGIYNFIDNVRIEEIKIVGLEDYVDNDKDNFTAYISGRMEDLLIRKNGTVQTSDSTDFEDIYYFKRKNGSWVLTNISNNVDIWNIIDLQVIHEKIEVQRSTH